MSSLYVATKVWSKRHLCGACLAGKEGRRGWCCGATSRTCLNSLPRMPRPSCCCCCCCVCIASQPTLASTSFTRAKHARPAFSPIYLSLTAPLARPCAITACDSCSASLLWCFRYAAHPTKPASPRLSLPPTTLRRALALCTDAFAQAVFRDGFTPRQIPTTATSLCRYTIQY
jgi:hypothetical protein